MSQKSLLTFFKSSSSSSLKAIKRKDLKDADNQENEKTEVDGNAKNEGKNEGIKNKKVKVGGSVAGIEGKTNILGNFFGLKEDSKALPTTKTAKTAKPPKPPTQKPTTKNEPTTHITKPSTSTRISICKGDDCITQLVVNKDEVLAETSGEIDISVDDEDEGVEVVVRRP